MTTITKPKNIPLSAEHRQIEQRLAELQAVDQAEAQRQADIAALIAQKKALEEAHQKALEEAEAKALLAEYDPAMQALCGKRDRLVADLKKLLNTYQAEVADQANQTKRTAQRLSKLGYYAPGTKDAVVLTDYLLGFVNKIPTAPPRPVKAKVKPAELVDDHVPQLVEKFSAWGHIVEHPISISQPD